MFWKHDIKLDIPASVHDWVIARTMSQDKDLWVRLPGGAIYSALTEADETPFSFEEARRKAISAIGITNACMCDDLKNYVIYAPPGTHIEPHHDGLYSGYSHRRLLYTVSQPDSGGTYVQGPHEFSFTPDAVYEIEADTIHHVTPVVGDKPLILLLLSYIIKRELVDV